jgi:hypothetical protein
MVIVLLFSFLLFAIYHQIITTIIFFTNNIVVDGIDHCAIVIRVGPVGELWVCCGSYGSIDDLS